MTDEKIVPTYKFVEEEGEAVSPIKKKIAKTMQVTETFTVFEAIQYVAKMKKAVEEKQAEIDGLNSMIKAYEDELEIIENELSVQAMETDYQKEIAENINTQESNA